MQTAGKIKSTAFVAMVATNLLASCDSSEFRGGAGKSRHDLGAGLDSGNPQHEVDTALEKDPNGAQTDTLGGSTESQCFGTSKHVDIVLVMDRSGSMERTDPQYVRRSSAQGFVGELLALVGSSKTMLRVSTSIVGFSEKAQVAYTKGGKAVLQGHAEADAWSEISDGSRSDINERISVASQAITNGKTYYRPPLELAQQLFQLRPESHKRYLVFLTDGGPWVIEPNYIKNIPIPADKVPEKLEELARIRKLIQSLTSQLHIAIYPIAAGEDIKPEWEDFLKSELALPQGGHHPGRYFRAKAFDDLADVWDSVFDHITHCN